MALDDSAAVVKHVVGRIRRPTLDEVDRAANLLRADAVLALTAVTADLPALLDEVARHIDGVRPVARIRKKSGASSADVRNALRALHERGMLRLVGIVEAAESASATAHAEEDATRRILESEMMISVRAMAEIRAMLDEDNAMLDRSADGGASAHDLPGRVAQSADDDSSSRPG